MSEKTLAELVYELEGAVADHASAKRTEEAARNEATDALNALNSAQKAVDAHMEKLRKDAPHNSDWKQTRYGVAP